MSDAPALVLAVHPSTAGFGWVLFEKPGRPVDWGLSVAHGDKNRECLRKLKRLIRTCKPDVILFEEFEGSRSRRSRRVRRLCKAICLLGTKSKISVVTIPRAEFPITRFDAARAVVQRFRELRYLMPPVRKPWMSEDRRMALLAAAAVAHAYIYQIGS